MERVGRDHICCVCWNLVPRLDVVFAALASAARICTRRNAEMIFISVFFFQFPSFFLVDSLRK